MKPKLSIIILNYNTSELTIKCVKSIVKYSKNLSYEVIIVDNASTDDSVSSLKKIVKGFKHIRLIVNNTNAGFAKGNNIGIKASRGDYVLLLNSDTYLTQEVFVEFLDWMDKRPTCGISSCRLKNEDGSQQSNGGYFPTLPRIWTWMLFVDDIPLLGKIIKPFHPGPSLRTNGDLDWLTGAFFMIKRDVIEDVGLLDEDYFMYVEDMDYCYRAKRNGWKVKLNDKFFIIHLGGKSSNRDFPIRSEFKALQLFYKKHKPIWQNGLLKPAFKIGSFLRIILFTLLGNRSQAKIYEKVIQQI